MPHSAPSPLTLRPGGLALIAPTYISETFVQGEVARDRRTAPDHTRLTLTSRVTRPDGKETTFELLLTLRIASPDGTVKLFEDRHRCGLFSESQWLSWLEAAGLQRLPHVAVDGPWRAYPVERI